MKMIEQPLKKWSVVASILLTAMWGTLSGAWVLIDTETQMSILADFGITMQTFSKVVAYIGLLAAMSTGLIGGLRVLKQQGALVTDDTNAYVPTEPMEK